MEYNFHEIFRKHQEEENNRRSLFGLIKPIISIPFKDLTLVAKEIVAEIFKTLDNDYSLLPDDLISLYKQSKDCDKKRIICDYISSMTDRYVLEYYGRLRSENPETIFKPI